MEASSVDDIKNGREKRKSQSIIAMIHIGRSKFESTFHRAFASIRSIEKNLPDGLP
ncbi:hypothetical protein [Azorhizobium oxalatiphilum]|uniref:hypothetical protein n=1 Tax=Azorhizobium oxalatiphilum TaxID=980631 RepID=UPI001664AC8F|nr:hypothetical protein [Azorhizobium oxalatiphilum]